MGYFKRKLDRGRARDAIQEMHDAALEEGEWAPWSEEKARQPKASFLRFAIGETSPISDRRWGLFSAAYILLGRPHLGEAERNAIQGELDWFSENLHAPDVDSDKAIFLFKSDAGECTRRIWHLVALLREAGYAAEMQVVENPGKVVYEDEHQVAVVPWSSVKGL
jgi:hypothetical protein